MQEYPVKKNINVNSVLTAFEVYYDENFVFNGEYHNFWELNFVIDGKIYASADENIYELSEGEIIFYKPMVFHRLWSKKGSDSHLFIMSFKADGKLTEKINDKAIFLTETQKSVLFSIINLLRAKSEKHHFSEPNDEYLKGLDESERLSQLIGNYLEILLLQLDDRHFSTPKLTEKTKIYKQIIQILSSNLNSQITVSELARQCSVSESTIKKIFSDFSDYSIHKYFINMKIIRAIELIKCGTPLSEISDFLGFDNQNYFSAVFKRITGYSPSHYKRLFID